MALLGLFAKYWEPGRVKTRLAAALGAEPAARLYQEFLRVLLFRFQAVADSRIVAYAPPSRRQAFAELVEEAAAGNWSLAAQSGGNLGERLAGFFAAALAQGFRQTVVIGSDSPTLPAAYVEEALARLREVAVVLGPARDGGYYLIGVAGTAPPVFQGIPWSTPLVFDRTVAALEAAGIRYALLPEWYDVDEPHDLVRLKEELTSQAEHGREFARLAQVLRETA